MSKITDLLMYGDYLTTTFDYKDEIEDFDDLKHIFNSDVNDCLMYMYFFMLANDDLKDDELFNEFSISYNKLDEEQKKYVKRDYLKITKAQDKNVVRARKKGNDKYE